MQYLAVPTNNLIVHVHTKYLVDSSCEFCQPIQYYDVFQEYRIISETAVHLLAFPKKNTYLLSTLTQPKAFHDLYL